MMADILYFPSNEYIITVEFKDNSFITHSEIANSERVLRKEMERRYPLAIQIIIQEVV